MTHAYEISSEANFLVATALAISDRMELAAERAAGVGGAGPAALVSLASPGVGETVGALARAVALSHSATVRLADRLETAGLVQRRPGADRRSVGLTLSPEGRRVVSRIHTARAEVAGEMLALLTDDQRLVLTIDQRRLLGLLDEHPGETGWVCRLCDRHACRHSRGGCPVEEATRRRVVAGYADAVTASRERRA